MAETGKFEVDPSELEALLRAMRSLLADLDSGPADQHLPVEASGSAPLSHALDDFSSRWGDGRRRVRDNLGGVVDTLQATLDDYRAHENVATAAIRGVGA